MRPFERIRVIECGEGIGLSYCGKLFSDFGAEVIKVESSAGDPLRRMPPLVDVGGGAHESGYFAWLNTNKRSVVADLDDPEDARRVTAMVAESHVLIDSRSPEAVARGELAHAALGAAFPGLIIAALSWFGESGPYRDYQGADSIVRALAGVIKGVGPVEGPPLLAHDGQSGVISGLAAFLPIAAALYGAEQGGRRVSISAHEALTLVVELDVSYALQGAARPRSGVNRFGRHYPASIYRAKDAWIGISVVTPAQWRALCLMLGAPEMAEDARYKTSADRLARGDELDALLEPLFAEASGQSWFERGMAHRLPLVIVPSMEQLLAQAVHRDRGAFVPVLLGEARFEGPILPQRIDDQAPLPGGRAPRLGEHVAFDPPTVAAAPRRPDHAATPGTLPLEGVRIVDLTMGWAGPLASRHLADLGAEIIKVEGCGYPDWYRGTDGSAAFFANRQYERAVPFNLMNRNKRGVTLDLTSPEGAALLKRLVADAHGVIENYSAEVLPKLGLDYPVLKLANPRVVMVSMAAFGVGNAWSNTRAYGGTLEQASGLPMVSGSEHWPPTMTTYAHGDPVGGHNAAAAMLIGLIRQRRSGEGCWINLSQIEGMLSMVAPSIVEQSAHGKVGPRLGNRHPVYAPQGCFRCAGEDAWLAVSVRDDEDWLRLCDVLGRTDLMLDPDLADAAGRRDHTDRIEAAISAWTTTRPADDAMTSLQAAGVPAGVARSTTELLDDPHLHARGYWQVVDRAVSGPQRIVSAPYRLGPDPLPIRLPAPTLGQDTADVLGALLGLSAAELQGLADRRVIGTEAYAKP